jgi:predicted ATPase
LLACDADLQCDGLRLVGSESALAEWPAVSSQIRSVRFHALDHAAMARPCRADSPVELVEDGANLAAAMHALRAARPEEFDAVAAEFGRILPEFKAIVPVKSGDQLALEFALHGENHHIRAADLSQGTLALLGVLFLASASPRPALLCIEEIDRGLHPRALREARDALYRLSHPNAGEPACQVLATTHSPYLLDLFRDQPEEVIIAEKTGSRANFRKLSDLADLKELLSEASLGDLWFSGVLGGVPEEE